VPTQCARVKGPVSPAGLALLTSAAAPCPRAGYVRALCSPSACGEKGQPHPPVCISCERCGARPPCRLWLFTGLPSAGSEGPAAPACHTHHLSAMPRHSTVPEVVTFGAALSVCGNCQRRQQALLLFRARPRQAVMPGVSTYSAAVRMCERASSTGSRVRSSAGQPIARAERVSASAAMRWPDLAPGVLRPGRPRCGRKDDPAASAGLGIPDGRSGAMPSCRMCPRTVQPSVRATGASSARRFCIPCVRCGTLTPCRV